MMKNTKLTGHILALFTAFVWGITFVSTKVLLTELSAVEILFYRFILGYAALWVAYPHKYKFCGIKNELLFMAAGICGTTVYQYMENTALTFTQASNVSIIVSAAPLFTVIAARLIFKEKTNRGFIIGFVLAMLGIMLINYNGSVLLKLNPTGDLLAFFAAVLWAVYTTLVRIINQKNYNILEATRHIFFYGIIFIIPLMIFDGFRVSSLHTLANYNILANILFLGVIASAICFATWNTAVKRLGSVKASVYIYLIPVITLIFSITILGEKAGFVGIAGMLLVLLGLVTSQQKRD